MRDPWRDLSARAPAHPAPPAQRRRPCPAVPAWGEGGRGPAALSVLQAEQDKGHAPPRRPHPHVPAGRHLPVWMALRHYVPGQALHGEGSITLQGVNSKIRLYSHHMHAKFGRRREHARGAPNRINHIPAADSANVISDQHRKWMNKTEKVFPFCSSKPEVQQTSIRPYTLPPTNMFWASPCFY